jgi:hypothetical protein
MPGLEYGRVMFAPFATVAPARTGLVAGAAEHVDSRLPATTLTLLAILLITHGGAG